MMSGFAGMTGADVRIVTAGNVRPRDFVGRQAPGLDEVLARAMVLTAVAYRGWSEVRQRTDAQRHETAQRLLRWLDRNRVMPGVEPDEARILHADVGALPVQECMGAAWRLEGAVVLGWAARLTPMCKYFELAQLPALMDVMDGVSQGRIEAGPMRPEHEVLRLMENCMDLLDVIEKIGALSGDPACGHGDDALRELELAGYERLHACQQDRDLITRATFERGKATRWLMGLSESYGGTAVPLRVSRRELV